ncbi:hypothetical protein [Ferranicluibacter rubi]|uniref:Uncharacterized protein n=1 Tax=Ferranicluibacter rubi TaxID=2715133 RepID=A0AA43ZCI7_9HYPH|nr:hypothetical protein [Ferranicluibacter rubi]NHT75309.1 hypothetical protein [Ferranicluibacter rubi]
MLKEGFDRLSAGNERELAPYEAFHLIIGMLSLLAEITGIKHVDIIIEAV